MQDKEAHARPIEEVVAGLQAHRERGLSQQEAAERKLRGVDQGLDIDASPPKIPEAAKRRSRSLPTR